MAMKRFREEMGEMNNTTAMAEYLMLLSDGRETAESITQSANRVFECKTCNRRFPSFQALGGHRASHKKPRLMGEDIDHKNPMKPKTHECSICGLGFTLGQSLGGHMRRHRNMISEDTKSFLCLDLNLTPFENELKQLQIGGLFPEELAARLVNCIM